MVRGRNHKVRSVIDGVNHVRAETRQSMLTSPITGASVVFEGYRHTLAAECDMSDSDALPTVGFNATDPEEPTTGSLVWRGQLRTKRAQI